MKKNKNCQLAATLFMLTVLLVWSAGAAQAQTLVAVNDSYGVPYDPAPTLRILSVETFGVLENDTLNDQSAGENGATVETVPVSDVSHGTLVLNADGSFSYEPDITFSGFDSFTYRAVFGAVTSDATVTLTACTGGPEVFSCWQESSYLAKLAQLGFSTFQEGFENDAAWGSVRTTNILNPVTHPSVTSLEISWTTNHPTTNGITTGEGPAFSGLWGVYDPNHGFATGTSTECDIDNPPAHCLFHDGFRGTRMAGAGALHGVGGFISGFRRANVAIILDGTHQVGVGKLPEPVFGHQFFGVIDAGVNGFAEFEFRELDGKVGQERPIGGDDFTFGTGLSPGNTPPVAVDNAYATVAGTLFSIAAPGVLGNDTDADGDPLTAILNVDPSNGTLTLNANGSFIYTSEANFIGLDTFSYHANDGTADSNIATVRITVTPPKDPPVANGAIPAINSLLLD